jgi:hypothetical protein
MPRIHLMELLEIANPLFAAPLPKGRYLDAGNSWVNDWKK